MALEVHLITPAEGGTESSPSNVTSVTPTIEWTLTNLDTGEIQVFWRVTIYSTGGFPTYIRSAANADTTHQVENGILSGNTAYRIQVEVVTSTGRSASFPLTGGNNNYFMVDAPVIPGDDPDTGDPCGEPITNLKLRPIGGSCNGGENVFPVLRLTWTAPVPCSGTLVNYQVHRREPGEEEYEIIGTSETTRYDDADVLSGKVYEYSVVYTVEDAGNTLISEDIDPVRGSITFDFLWLHSIDDPTLYLRVPSHAVREEVEQDLTLIRGWGRRQPTAFFGHQQSKKFTVNGLGSLLRLPTEWERIEDLLTAQREGAILCARFGRAKSKVNCIISRASRAHTQARQEPTLELVEVAFRDARGVC